MPTEHMNLNWNPLEQPHVSSTRQQYQAACSTPVSQFVINHPSHSLQNVNHREFTFQMYLYTEVILEPADHLDGRQSVQSKVQETFVQQKLDQFFLSF